MTDDAYVRVKETRDVNHSETPALLNKSKQQQRSCQFLLINDSVSDHSPKYLFIYYIIQSLALPLWRNIGPK